MSLSLLVPMRGNPIRRELFAYTLIRAMKSIPVDLVIRCDDDDPETALWVKDNLPNPKILIGPRRQGYRSLPRFFNEMAKHATGDLLMCGNDDMRFETDDWPAYLMEAASHYRDGVFNLGVMTSPVENYPFSCVSRKLVSMLGFINDERLVFSDLFLRDVTHTFCRSVLVPQVLIRHVGTVSAETQQVKDDVNMNTLEYRVLHDACVAEAVAKIRPHVR